MACHAVSGVTGGDGERVVGDFQHEVVPGVRGQLAVPAQAGAVVGHDGAAPARQYQLPCSRCGSRRLPPAKPAVEASGGDAVRVVAGDDLAQQHRGVRVAGQGSASRQRTTVSVVVQRLHQIRLAGW